MFCHKCGNQAADGAEFCHKCGTRIAADETVNFTLSPEPRSPGYRDYRRLRISHAVLCDNKAGSAINY